VICPSGWMHCVINGQTGPVVTQHGIDLLRAMTLFRPLDDAALREVRGLGSPRSLDPGDVLVRQGDRGDHVYVVLSGAARVELDGTELGPPVEPGECVGELAALDGAPRAATVTASNPMSVLEFTVEDFGAALEAYPELRQSVTRALTRRLRHASAGWAQLAVDTEVLLEAYLVLQGSDDGGDRDVALRSASDLVRGLAATSPASEQRVEASALLGQLTPAEHRVAAAVARGLSNAGVAAELSLSEHTVASHLKHIYLKLDLTSRVTLATLVLRST